MLKPRMSRANVASRKENDPPGQTTQNSTEGHTEIDSLSNTAAPERSTQLPATITPNESPDGANEATTGLAQVNNDDEDAATATDLHRFVDDQEDLDSENQGQSHPAETVNEGDGDEEEDAFSNIQTLPQINRSNAIQGNMTTMSSITP